MVSENGFNQFLILENHMLDTKILILGALGKKVSLNNYNPGGHLGF